MKLRQLLVALVTVLCSPLFHSARAAERPNNKGDRTMSRAVCDGRFWAVNNLIGDPAFAETVAQMRVEFASWRTFSKDSDIHPSRIPRRTQK